MVLINGLGPSSWVETPDAEATCSIRFKSETAPDLEMESVPKSDFDQGLWGALHIQRSGSAPCSSPPVWERAPEVLQ